MHPIQNEMVTIQRHEQDVRHAAQRASWHLADAGTRVRRPARRSWLRRATRSTASGC
jgi:hypothetical protein